MTTEPSTLPMAASNQTEPDQLGVARAEGDAYARALDQESGAVTQRAGDYLVAFVQENTGHVRTDRWPPGLAGGPHRGQRASGDRRRRRRRRPLRARPGHQPDPAGGRPGAVHHHHAVPVASVPVPRTRALEKLWGWERHGNGIPKLYLFDDFGSAVQFVGRVADNIAAIGHQPAVTIRGGRVTVELEASADDGLSGDDLAVAARIRRLVGDHHPPVGRAGPWSPGGRLTGVRQRPVGHAGP
jgi:pterin-4a-carbinolamine dehydratase